jgi:hypothetical protein
MQKKNWDVFISHASEDKSDFADEIVRVLISLGIKVWYDNEILNVGDSISKTIDKGLSLSKYGIVIISENFVRKGWTEYEFRSLINREIGNRKIILPIWHKVEKETIQQYCPYLLDKFALDSSKLTINQIILALIKVIKPNLYKNIGRELLWKKLISNSKNVSIDRKEIKQSDIRHKTLPKLLLLRLKNLYYSIFSVLGIDFEKMVDSFKRDLRPHDEIVIWELINLCYQEYINKTGSLNNKKDIISQLLLISLGSDEEIDGLLEDEQIKLLKIWKKNYLLYIK